MRFCDVEVVYDWRWCLLAVCIHSDKDAALAEIAEHETGKVDVA